MQKYIKIHELEEEEIVRQMGDFADWCKEQELKETQNVHDETSDSDNALIYFNCKVDDKVYPSFLTIKECVDYLTSPEGIGICSNRDIKPVEVKK